VSSPDDLIAFVHLAVESDAQDTVASTTGNGDDKGGDRRTTRSEKYEDVHTLREGCHEK